MKPRISKTVLLLMFALLLLGSSCQENTPSYQAEYRDITEAIYSTVTVRPRLLYNVYAPVSGIIDYSNMEEGEIVKKGDQLFQVKNQQSDFTSANARLNYEIAKDTYQGDAAILRELEESIHSATLRVVNDSLNYQRQSRLREKNINALNDYEKSALVYELSRSELNRLLNSYERTKKELGRKMKLAENTLSISNANRDEFEIKSKIDGTIYEIFQEAGESVSPQTPVALIGSTDDFILTLLVDEVDISKIFPGQKTIVSLDAYGERVFVSEISRIYPTKDERSQTFTVEAFFVDQPQRLFNGLSGEANIIIARKQAILSLSNQLISENNEVNTADGYRKVETGISDLKFTEIISGIDTSTVIYQLQ